MRFNVALMLRRAAGLFGSAMAGGLMLVAAPAQAAEPVPTEAFFKAPTVLKAQLSPSGRRLAITAPAQGRIGLFVVDLQSGDFKANGAALFNDVDVEQINWVDDERLVFNVVDLQLGLAEDNYVAPGLFAVRFDGSELRHLVARQGSSKLSNGERARALPWNHRLLHVPAASEDRNGAHADEVIIGELRFDRRELRTVQPLWLNTRTGRTRVLDTIGSPDYTINWWFSPQGQPRAVLTRHEGREALHWYQLPHDDQPGRWVQLTEGKVDALPFYPAWLGSGELLYVRHSLGPRGEQVIAPFDFTQNRPGTALVTAPGFDFSGELIGDPEGKRLLGVRIDTDAEQTVWFDPAMKAIQERVNNSLLGRTNRVYCRRCGADDAAIVVQAWSDRFPGELLFWNKGLWKVISLQRPDINPDRMGTLDLVRIRARDGRDLPVWVTRPAGFQRDRPLPAVVMVHGGPWVRQGHWRWDPMAQFLASRGYVVIEPEFRGSAGYGAAHLQAGFKQFGQAMQDDVTDALRWAQAEKIASDKACIVGGGYGGYSTLMGLIRDPEVYRCGSAWVAVADLMLFLEGGWFVSDDISDSGRKYYLPDRVGDAERDRAMLLANSPVEQAALIRAPLQLIWGDDSLRAPLAHGKRLRSAMQKAGLEPEWIVYEGEAQGWRKTENQIDMALKLEAFLAKYLK